MFPLFQVEDESMFYGKSQKATELQLPFSFNIEI